MRDITPAVGVVGVCSAGESRCASASAPRTRTLLQRRHAENKKYDSEREDNRAAVKFKPREEEEEEDGFIGGITAGALWTHQDHQDGGGALWWVLILLMKVLSSGI